LSESPKRFCGRGDEALSHRTSLLSFRSLLTCSGAAPNLEMPTVVALPA
jgi:hypothetical protein